MATKIIGDLTVSDNIIINGDNPIKTVNSVDATPDGNINIPIYNTSEVNKILSTLPVTRVGTMDYLPLNINGSFEGATNYQGKGIYPCILENDGTYVYIRPGTNGSTDGFYYCYIKSAREAVALKPTLTNEKYIPTFFTASHKLISFVGSNAGEILMMRTNNGSSDTYTLSLTNGTLNAVSHQSVEFPRTLISGTDPQYVIINNNIVYILCLDGYDLSSEFSISVYAISVVDIVAGVYTSLTKITGFSGNNLFGDAVSASTNIKLATKYFSTVPAEKSLYCIPTGNAYTNFVPFWGNAEGSLHAEKSGNNIRIVFMHGTYAVTFSSLVINNTNISLVLNTSTKNYSVDNTNKGQVTITTDANGIITWNNPYYVDSVKYYGVNYTGMGGGRCPTVFTSRDGVQFFTISTHTDETEHRVGRCKLDNFSSAYDSWNFNVYNTTNMLVENVYPVYGSPIGDNLLNPILVSKNKIILNCFGTENGITPNRMQKAYTSLGNTHDFVYSSLNSGSLNGFAPNVDRNFLDNTDYKYTGCVTIMNQDGSTEVHASSFIEGLTKKTAINMDQNTMVFGQDITINSGVLSTLKAAVIAGVTLPNTVKDSKIVLYYVPNTSYTKSFAITTLIDNSTGGVPNLYYIISEVDVTISSFNITSATVTSNKLINANIYAIQLGYSYMIIRSGLIIAKYPEFTYVGIPDLINAPVVGSTVNHSFICKVQNSTKLLTGTPKMIRSWWISSSPGSYEVGVLPNIGFGVYENGNITDMKTKLVFKNFGTTEAQFDSMIANIGGAPLERIVVAAQDVPQGYTIYFTQEVPVFLSGKFFKLPPQSINLEDLFSTVQNKTFYIYISIVGNIPQYQITETLQTEDLFRTYIGTIITDSTNISSISSEKVTRFLTYRTSTTKRGSAIPTSTGVPSSTGTRWN